MIVLEATQMDALADARRRSFTDEMIEHAASFPDVPGDEEERGALVRSRLDEGHATGLRSRYDLRRYLELALEAAPEGGALPDWALNVLRREDLHPTDRMDRLDRLALFPPAS